MKTLFTLIILLISFSTLAQKPSVLWLKGYGGDGTDDIGTRVTKTYDNGFIVNLGSLSGVGTGTIDSFCSTGGYRSIFLKFDSTGTLKWSKCISWFGDSALGVMYPSKDGNYVFGGEFNSSTGWGFIICKIDNSGSVLWQKNYSKGGDILVRDMIEINDGGYIMAGQGNYTDSNFTIHHGSWLTDDIAILKIDSLGNKVWSKVIGGTQEENVFSIVPGPHGGCYILGYTASDDYDCTGNHGGTTGSWDGYLARLDSNGNLLWHHDLGGTGDDAYSGWGVADGKDGVLIALQSGSADGDIHHYVGGNDFWLLDVDSNNHILWDNSFGSPIGNETPMAICRATDNSIWITGVSGTAGGEVDTLPGLSGIWVVHADSIGNYLGSRALGGMGTNEGRMIYPLADGKIMVGGDYDAAGAEFSSLVNYGDFDAFLAILAPWDNTGVQEIVANSEAAIFPNPACGLLNIKVASGDKYSITITDVTGRQFYFGVVEKGADTVNVASWPQGLYFVHLQNENGLNEVKTIIVK